jgi:hypothetical protein
MHFGRDEVFVALSLNFGCRALMRTERRGNLGCPGLPVISMVVATVADEIGPSPLSAFLRRLYATRRNGILTAVYRNKGPRSGSSPRNRTVALFGAR